nr:MAG: hypothetical protein J07AB56_09420 [Candidatus Nanosalinarum sp. J07AB56]
MEIGNSTIFHLERSLVGTCRSIHDKLESEDKNNVTRLFDPEDGTVIAKPPRDEEGFWVGCPSIIYEQGCFYLYYRVRGKRRGSKGILAESSDGINFEQIKEFDKTDLGATSIEGASIRKCGELFELYISYQDKESRRWRIGVTSSPNFQNLNPSGLEQVFTGSSSHYHIKDPVIDENGFFAHSMSKHYLSSCAVEIEKTTEERIKIREISPDTLNVDSFRITSVMKLDDNLVVFYDYQPSILHVWEERSGLATTESFERFKCKENFRCGKGTGSLRYVNAARHKDEVFLYYETSTEEGGHELRMNNLAVEDLQKYVS